MHDEYPYYGWGIFFGFMFSFFSAMNFLSIKSVGANIHPSLKTYYFGLFSTVICLIIAALGAD